jgi:hypothetical protein
VSVYFITCREVNMVKIGYSNRVRARFTSVKVCCPIEARLELMLLGGKEEEKAIHAALKNDRVRGEWFWITEAVQRFIDNPPPAPKEHADLDAPYTNLEQHEKLVKRIARKRRSRSEAETAALSRLALSRSRETDEAEKRLAAAHHNGNRELARLEAKGEITFPFRQLEDAES